jgi:hypothetical protein
MIGMIMMMMIMRWRSRYNRPYCTVYTYRPLYTAQDRHQGIRPLTSAHIRHRACGRGADCRPICPIRMGACSQQQA